MVGNIPTLSGQIDVSFDTFMNFFIEFHRDIFNTITTSTAAAATTLIAVYGRLCECLSNIPFDHLV